MSADTHSQDARDIELPRDERPWYLKRGGGAGVYWDIEQKIRKRGQMRTSECIPPTGHFSFRRKGKASNNPQ